jgi:DNA-binding transcriptional MerR regulator
MKLTQLQINPVYAAFKNLTYTGMNLAEIGKIMRMCKAMRPYFESYQTFDEEVRQAQENYGRLAEIEMKGDEKTVEDIAWYKEHIRAFIEGVNIAIQPELEREYEIEIEKLSDDTVAYILSNSQRTHTMIDFLIE